MFALDTNTIIDFLRGRGEVAERLLATPPREVALPAVVLYELEFGAVKSRASESQRSRLQVLTQAFAVWPFGAAEARIAARLRAELERRGTPIGPYDLLIAATVLVRGAVLVTHNTQELSRVPGLRLDDWF